MTRSKQATVAIPGLDVAKARRYNRTRLAVLAVSTAWSVARLAWFASERRAARLKARITEGCPDSHLAAPAFLGAASLIAWGLDLPVSYLGGYLVERHYGLTRQTGGAWLAEQVKALGLGLVIQVPLMTAAFAVIRHRPRDWWLVLSGATVPLMVIFSNLAPVLLMPRFNRFAPLQDIELEARIRALAERSGVRVSDVLTMDMSRQSEKPNAFFAGVANTKRIVLADTLLARFDHDEIEGVVAHEIGHQAHGDLWRLIGFGASAGFGMAWLLSRLSGPTLRLTRERTGVASVGDEAALPVLALLTTALGVGLMPLQAAFSRSLEWRADRFAVALTGNPDAYARTLEKLAAYSLADPDPPRVIVRMLYSHPPFADRIRVARGGSAPRSKGSPFSDITA